MRLRRNRKALGPESAVTDELQAILLSASQIRSSEETDSKEQTIPLYFHGAYHVHVAIAHYHVASKKTLKAVDQSRAEFVERYSQTAQKRQRVQREDEKAHKRLVDCNPHLCVEDVQVFLCVQMKKCSCDFRKSRRTRTSTKTSALTERTCIYLPNL